ncbi:MAG TPA: double-strand break repair helicase AddA [Methyloceanibacter sp.]|nr:double-strand break repair helicase AddA [Methyloceanibacter sp.]
MSADLLHTADANQARASDPAASAWVSANAGTGKTEVLVKRTLRLLLDGARPESVLCLTYTKTAAAEMQNRLLKDLASWATMPAAKLHEALAKLMWRKPEDEDLRGARRLFARALEARGGLKIHTIHGFCERLLQRFPLESGVTPHFTVLDDRGAALLKRRAFDAVITRAAEDRDSPLGRALDTIITVAGEEYFRQVVDTVLGKRAELAQMNALHGGLTNWAEAEGIALKQLFGVAGEADETLVAALASVVSDAEINTALSAFGSFGSTKDDAKTADGLRGARGATDEARAAALKFAFLTAKGEPRARVCSKAFRDAAPHMAEALETARDRVAELDIKLALLRAAEASWAVLALANAIQDGYVRRKQAEAALDYDDLIVKARNLLSRSGAAAWVLYKIDGGVDHILVDEAQDTNPEQWAIIQALAEEFFAGAGAHDRLRTLFAVGDEKQSIYSFQGANPARFGAVGREFKKRAGAAGVEWHEVPLNLSFRSTVPVLDAVDSVFARPEAAQGLTFVETAVIQHHAHRQGQAGLVELWEPLGEDKRPAVSAFEPWSEEPGGARSVDALCKRIAATIKHWRDSGAELKSAGRKVRPGDILILVRRREPFTAPMIRELKRLNIPVAGADRMRLMDQLAVQDLVALADVLLMPEDDLALAVVLKSPLFGLDDDALFDLAYDRKVSLWAALKDKAGADARFAEPAARLAGWLNQADTRPPYEFFAELLGADGQEMRKRVLVRLGPEAAEAIDEFLDAALGYDREAAPSLQGFVNQLRAGDIEIKRDMEQDRDEVRIMTVHGAKGLQAPIVFLPDTCVLPRAQGPRLFPVARRGAPPEEVTHLVWAPGRSGLEAIAEAKETMRRAEIDEYHRLLYVAMTRARDRLYVCGWQGQKEPERDCWYNLVRDGLDGRLTPVNGPGGVRRMVSAQEQDVPLAEAEAETGDTPPLPDWALTQAPLERVRTRLAPSRLALGAEAGPEAETEQPPLGPRALADTRRFARGRLVHALLQHLPEVAPDAQEQAALAFVAARGTDLSETLKAEIVAETLAIVRDAQFAPLFRPGSLAEVPVVARIGAGEASFDIGGQIDRLVIRDNELLILDYKTNRPPPATEGEVADAYLNQLAEYRLALVQLFPGRTIKAALLWTDGPHLMEISSTSLDKAERDMLDRQAALTP